MSTPRLRLRSDEQLVTLFRDGHDEAFRVIHDRYHKRLAAYTRQMLPRPQDAEEAVQDVFVRVYTNLRASDRGVVNLRPWLYRTAHNRCIDELRRPSPPPPEALADMRSPIQDPVAQVVERESLRRLLKQVKRLPAQQRSALLLRELDGAHYADIATALGTTIPAVKSLLIRARMTLASSLEACDTPCSTIREELTIAHDRRIRSSGTARAHLRDCPGCRAFREELRGTSRQLAGLVPTLGPLGVLANALGFVRAGSGASTSCGAAVAGGGGALASAGIGTGHIATLIAAAVATAGGAVEVRNAIVAPPRSPTTATVVISNSPPRAAAAPTRSIAPTPRLGVVSHAAARTHSAAARTNSAAARTHSAAARTHSAALPPRRVVTAPTIAPTGPSTSPAPASAPVARSTRHGNATPVRQPSITGIDAVSKPEAAPPSAIGHTSITGIADVSALTPSGTALSGGGGGSSSTTSSPSTTSSGGSPTGNGSQSSTTRSAQDTSLPPGAGASADSRS